MTVWGPAGESGRGIDATIPLPASDVPAGPGPAAHGSVVDTVASGGGYVPAGYGPATYGPSPGGPAAPGRRPHRARRVLLRMLGAVMSLALLAIMAFGGLLLVTPSAGNAPELVRAQDLAHHVAYPGPPVPPRFAASLVATEDKRFYAEPGIDLFAVGRVGISWVTGHGIQGGATLYQQLAKLLYTHGSSASAADEAEQVALAVKLYLTFTKRQILQMYADVAYFGNGFYGLAAASCGYFGVPPAGMTWPQAALLAGMVQGPSLDDPLTNPANARAREVHVVGRLVATGKLTPAQGRAALAAPLSRLVTRAGQGCSA
jgi:membrane carboxypeptidase/penicillin-binding protein PbpC